VCKEEKVIFIKKSGQFSPHYKAQVPNNENEGECKDRQERLLEELSFPLSCKPFL
jgi:hypothetical protein